MHGGADITLEDFNVMPMTLEDDSID
jgi:hypothetical protein